MNEIDQKQMHYIEERVFNIRGLQVMLDSDLAELYGVETKRLNEQVRRNSNRFPESFRFQLSTIEKNELVAKCDRFRKLKHSSNNPYAFTEHGVAMLSAVLRSQLAINISIKIIEAFVGMRKLLLNQIPLIRRFETIECRLDEVDSKFEKFFHSLESRNKLPDTGIFFEGQVFDAWVFVSDLVRSAMKSIVLIDNYVDDTVLKLFLKRNEGVNVTIFTRNITPVLTLEAEKFNRQYGGLRIRQLTASHDRFMIIDEKGLYHIGASLKDLGKRWFAFSKIDTLAPAVLHRLQD
jgi:hypothetical protein